MDEMRNTAMTPEEELIVTALGGGRFSVKAKDGYQEGATYELAIARYNYVSSRI